jgi:hypothetical protein
MSKLCIGMFGTCGKTTWRKELFIPSYEKMGLVEGKDFFNPQVEDWKPEMARIEAEHLSEDSVILFPVTSETYGLGSLAETGYSILQSIRLDDRRDLIILIDEKLDEKLMEDKEKAKDSLNARALVKQHIKKLTYSNLYVVDTLEEMRDLSVVLYASQKLLKDFQNKYNPHKRFTK